MVIFLRAFKKEIQILLTIWCIDIQLDTYIFGKRKFRLL